MKKATEKKKFDLNKYKTHQGPQGSPEQWREAVKQALLVDPTATVEEIEAKLTKFGMRKIQVD